MTIEIVTGNLLIASSSAKCFIADAGGSSFSTSVAKKVPNWTAFDADACAVFCIHCRSVVELELLGVRVG